MSDESFPCRSTTHSLFVACPLLPLCRFGPLSPYRLTGHLLISSLFSTHNPRFFPKIQENRQNAWSYQKYSVSLHPLRPLYSILGEMAEWSNAPVLKTGVLQGTGGSNPSLSATNAENQQIAKQTPSFTPKNIKSGVFVLFKIIQPLHNKRVAILKESDEKRLIFIYPFSLIFQDFTSS